MKTINISVRDKLPTVTAMSGSAVADNKYRLMFEFDDEWVEGLKTVIVAVSQKQYTAYPTVTDYVDVVLDNARTINVGIIQDTVATSRPCQIIVNESIRRHMGEEIAPPEPDVWEYITNQIRTLSALSVRPVDKQDAMTQQVGKDADGKLWTFPGGGGSSAGIAGVSLIPIFNSNGGPIRYALEIKLTNGESFVCNLPDAGDTLEDIVTVSPSSPIDAGAIGRVGELWFDTSERMLYVCVVSGMVIGVQTWLPVSGNSSSGGTASKGVVDAVFLDRENADKSMRYTLFIMLEDGTRIERELPGLKNEDVIIIAEGPPDGMIAPRGKLYMDIANNGQLYVCVESSSNGSQQISRWVPVSGGGDSSEVYIGTDTPPAGTKIWVNPDGDAEEDDEDGEGGGYGLPEHTEADENKFLRVVGGKAAWAADTKQERFLGADKAGARLVVGSNGYITTEFPVVDITETAAVVSATPVSGSEIKVISHVEQGVWSSGYTLVLRHVSGKNVMNIAEYLRKDFGGNTVTRDGLTAVINDDDTITVTGTAATTSSGYAKIANSLMLWKNGGELMFPAGTYTLPTDSGMRFALELYDDSGAWIMNATGTFTIDKQFYVSSIIIGWLSGTVVNAEIPLAMVMGNKLPSTGLKYDGAEYRVKFSSTNMTSGTYNWQTGELVTETGARVWETSDMGPFPALDGENVLFTGAGTVEVTYSAIGSSGATAVIGGGEKFDPEAWGLPVLYLTGDTATMTKDNAVELRYTYDGKAGTCTMKWQGSSSVAYLKKNYTIKFDNAFEAAEGWGPQTKYCLKANYIDHSHARNIVNARLWGQIVASRKTVPSVFANLPNYGAVDGFPVLIMMNNTFHGLYTFNIPKEGWMMGMGSSGANECILCAGNACPANGFKEAANLVDDLEIEYISDKNNTAWAVTSVNRLINACINSDGTDIDTTIAQYLDWDSAIDYYIFAVLIEGWDIMLKNYILATFNGIKWYFSAYDLDSTHGLHWDGSKFLPANYDPSFESYANQHRAMELVRLYKKDALKARYAELRESVLSESNVATMFGNFCGQIPSAVYSQEAKTWAMIPNTSVNNVGQIRDYYRMRVAYADKWMEEL